MKSGRSRTRSQSRRPGGGRPGRARRPRPGPRWRSARCRRRQRGQRLLVLEVRLGRDHLARRARGSRRGPTVSLPGRERDDRVGLVEGGEALGVAGVDALDEQAGDVFGGLCLSCPSGSPRSRPYAQQLIVMRASISAYGAAAARVLRGGRRGGELHARGRARATSRSPASARRCASSSASSGRSCWSAAARTVTLTEAGAAVLPFARDALAAVAGARARGRGAHRPAARARARGHGHRRAGGAS